MEDLAFIGLGMRRQAADIQFIRLLEYYGEGEAEDDEEALKNHAGNSMYPQLYTRASSMMDLDPYFRYGCLYFAGALAFNLERPQEAVALMTQALARDPGAWQYRLYMAAIAYKKDQEFGKLADSLEPALKDPDCPSMLKSIVAGIYLKLGRVKEAIDLYEQLAENSKDPGFREIGRQRLEKILKDRP